MTGFTDDEREWLEPDGLGGFAMGTASGLRTRRYHGLLLTATTPPTGRMMLVNGFDAWIETASGRYAISPQRYAVGGNHSAGVAAAADSVVHPDGASRIESFTADPWPTWTFRLDDGTLVQQEIVIPHEQAAATVTWRLLATTQHEGARTVSGARLIVRQFLSGRDYHATHHENGSIRTGARQDEANGVVVWEPYDGVPAIVSRANARYEHQPDSSAWTCRRVVPAESDLRDRRPVERADRQRPRAPHRRHRRTAPANRSGCAHSRPARPDTLRTTTAVPIDAMRPIIRAPSGPG